MSKTEYTDVVINSTIEGYEISYKIVKERTTLDLMSFDCKYLGSVDYICKTPPMDVSYRRLKQFVESQRPSFKNKRYAIVPC